MASLDSNLYSEFLETKQMSRYVTVFTTLNMQFVQQIIGSAESGKIGDLYQLYEFIEASDARLKGMINNRRKAVSKFKYLISAGNRDNPKSIEAADFVAGNFEALKWKAYIAQLMDGRAYGVQMHQKVWKSKDGKLCIDKLVPVDKSKYEQNNQYLIDDQTAYGELIISEYLTGSRVISAQSLVDESVLTLAVDKEIKGKYDLQGFMRGIARWYLIKLFAIMNWSQYAEKYGHPVVTATVSEELLTKSRSLITQLISSVGPNRYGLLLQGMDYKIHNGSNSANVEVFEKLIALANTEMAIGILGQNLTTDVSGGSLAASKTHLEVLSNIIEDDAEWIDEIINDQIVNNLVRVNFPDLAFEDYPKYQTHIPEEIDIQKISNGLLQASRIVPIPVSHIYKKLGIPEPQDNEETIGGNGSSLLDSIVNS